MLLTHQFKGNEALQYDFKDGQIYYLLTHPRNLFWGFVLKKTTKIHFYDLFIGGERILKFHPREIKGCASIEAKNREKWIEDYTRLTIHHLYPIKLPPPETIRASLSSLHTISKEHPRHRSICQLINCILNSPAQYLTHAKEWVRKFASFQIKLL